MQHPYSLAVSLSLSKERELKGLKGLAENRFWRQAILQPLPWHDAYLDLKLHKYGMKYGCLMFVSLKLDMTICILYITNIKDSVGMLPSPSSKRTICQVGS